MTINRFVPFVPLRQRPYEQSEDYLSVVDLEEEILKPLNGEPRRGHRMVATAYHLVLDCSLPLSTSIYAKIVGTPGDERRDLSSLTLSADIVELRGPLRFPQTAVYIVARELRVSAASEISTEPLPYERRAKDCDSSDAQDGARGMPGGDLVLAVQTAVVEGVFRLKGGPGQAAGWGRGGAVGPSVPAVNFDGGFHLGWRQYCINKGIDPDHVILIQNPLLPHTKQGLDQWPGNGTAASPSGMPGSGGDGGMATIRFASLGDFLSTPGGQSAETSKAFTGGPPGSPNPAFKCYHNGPNLLQIQDRHSTQKGEDAVGLEPKHPTGKPGKVQVDASLGWLNSHVVDRTIAFALDLLRANHRDLAGQLLHRLDVAIDQHREHSWRYATAEALHLQVAVAKIASLQSRLEAGLDVYGRPLGWVPQHSLEVMVSVYEREITETLELLLLHYQLANRVLRAEEMETGLRRAAAQLVDELAELNRTLEQLRTDVVRFQDALDALESEIALLKKLVEQEEARLRDLAGHIADAQKDEFELLKIGISLAVTVLSAGTAFGKANIAAGVAEVISNLAKLDSQAKWTQGEQTAQHLRDVVASLQKGRGLYDQLKSAGGTQTKAEQIFEQLKANSTYYGTLTNDLGAAIESSQRVSSELIRLLDLLRATVAKILDRLHQSAVVRQDRLAGYQFSVADVAEVIGRLVRENEERLLKYQYDLVLAFEYEFLEAFPRPMALSQTMRRVGDILRLTADGALHDPTPDEVKGLLGTLRTDLAAVRSAAIDISGRGVVRHSSLVEFAFNREDLGLLNQRTRCVIDPQARGVLYNGEENLRLKGLSIQKLELQIPPDARAGSIKLVVRHPGWTRISSRGRQLLFRHGSDRNSGFQWEFTYSVSRMQIRDDGRIVATRDSLRSATLTAGGVPRDLIDIRDFIYPGLAAPYEVELRAAGVTGFKVEELVLEASYEYENEVA